MALAKGVNSYVDVAEADVYFNERLDVSAWINAPDLEKGQALVSATAHLDELSWVGVAVSESQPLAFPRSGSYFDPRTGSEVRLNEELPARIFKATCETAYHLLNNAGLFDDTGSLETLGIGSISLGGIKAPNKLPSAARVLIAPLRMNGGSSLWWRAN